MYPLNNQLLRYYWLEIGDPGTMNYSRINGPLNKGRVCGGGGGGGDISGGLESFMFTSVEADQVVGTSYIFFVKITEWAS